MPVEFTQESIQASVAEWQKILRLQDWEIEVELVRYEGFDSLGNILPDYQYKHAKIWLKDPALLGAGDWKTDLEHTLVHELLHLHCEIFSKGFEKDTPQYEALEQMLNLNTKAMLSLRRKAA